MFYNSDPLIFERAKKLRESMTEAEKLLWDYLKGNKVLGYRFKAQHPIDRFIADFYCHKAKLVIELDGEIHESDEAREKDENRTAEFERFGIKVIRFNNSEVLYKIETVIDKIKECL